ncbi:MAG: endolytic transglycosylase MltG [Ignavibacteriales bacterium]|nr:endolytic transglycosylase MltG [Ignavibacteriales bacterium]
MTDKRLNGSELKLKRDLRVDSAAFVNKTNDKEFIKTLGLDVPNLEGYLFSKTYLIYERTAPEEIIKIFYDELKQFFNDTLKQRAAKIGFDLHKTLTLASIIKGKQIVLKKCRQFLASIIID